MQVSKLTHPPRSPSNLTTSLLATGSLELKAEKQNAHAQKFGESIKAVQFSPDGSTIVSCGVDKTIKVWDAGVGTDTLQPLTPDLTASVLAAASLELKAEKQSAHSGFVFSVAFSPDGKSIVSGSMDETTKSGMQVCRPDTL